MEYFLLRGFAVAETVDSSELFRAPSVGGKRKYNWELWQDGRTWKITKGVDFFCSLRSMRLSIGIRAKYVGLNYKTVTNKDNQTITFQFSPHTK